jgi:poly-gamma-glutamate synthesis protein (capsule biosynthesis protein)
MYFPTVSPTTGALIALRMTPMQMRGLRLCRPSDHDASWLTETLDEVSTPFGVRVGSEPDGRLLARHP